MNAIDVPRRAITALEVARDQNPNMPGFKDALAILRLCQRITYFEVEPERVLELGPACRATPPAFPQAGGKRA